MNLRHGKTEYVFEDFPVVQLDSHTDYTDTLYLHVQTEYVAEDHYSVQLGKHTDYKDT